jgi:hypothetical protein
VIAGVFAAFRHHGQEGASARSAPDLRILDRLRAVRDPFERQMPPEKLSAKE